jgi:hydroxymethylpyrimidine pyrophosphatase-like HAD family hydrolase
MTESTNGSRQINTMLVFDLDGVVTDPTSGNNNIDLRVIEIIAEDLNNRIPVAFNTGRGMNWVEENILPNLQDVSPEAFSLLVMVGEKGGVVARCDENVWSNEVDKELSLPVGFQDAVKALLVEDQPEGYKFLDYMYWDESKMTMGSIEKLQGISLEAFSSAQHVLNDRLKELMADFKLENFILDSGIIATDIQHISAGKHKGAHKILDWLESKKLSVESFETFGDSPTDAEMAETLSETGKPTSFVFVGEKSRYEPAPGALYKVHICSGRYSADTFAYLQQLRSV